MQSTLLDTPNAIAARLGWDPATSEHDRKRILAKQLVAARLGLEEKEIIIERESPSHFGFHTQLHARTRNSEVPLIIRSASFRFATVCAIAQPDAVFGLDLRDQRPDDETIEDIKRGSRLFETNNIQVLIDHWTRVQAIRAADGRGARIKPTFVQLDSTLTRGWLPDRPARYSLRDLSTDGWVITLAHVE